MLQRGDQRTMAYSAAGIYAGATFLGLVEGAIPGGPAYSLVPGLAALVLAIAIVLFGTRVPRGVLMLLGPLGVALIGVALAETHDYGDGAVLYMWPVLWIACFFSTRTTALIVAWVGVVHAVVLLVLPAGQGNVDRWLDVMVGVVVVAAVVRTLAARNERLVRRLEDEARVDPLTGLLNRRGFDERIHAELSRSIRERTSLAVVTLDLDHFKRVNDAHGHEVGDRVLAWIGGVLTEQVRGIDVAARIGGEEFVVVLPRTDVAAAHAFAERVRAMVASGGPLSGRSRFGVADTLIVTVSGGVVAEVAPIDVQVLLDAADQAMYSAKRAGRDKIVAARTPASAVELQTAQQVLNARL